MNTTSTPAPKQAKSVGQVLAKKSSGPNHVDRLIRFDRELDSAMRRVSKMERMPIAQFVRGAVVSELRRRNALGFLSKS